MEELIKKLETARDDLFYAMPVGEVKAWDLILLIQKHINALNVIIDESKIDYQNNNVKNAS